MACHDAASLCQGLIQLYLCTIRPDIVLFCVLLKIVLRTLKRFCFFVELLWFVQFCAIMSSILLLYLNLLLVLYYGRQWQCDRGMEGTYSRFPRSITPLCHQILPQEAISSTSIGPF